MRDALPNALPRRRIRSGAFLLAILVIIGVSALSYIRTQRLIATSDALERTQIIRYELETLISMLKDAETGQRGYLITGDEWYLESYRAAVRDVPWQLEHLGSLLRQSPGQQEQLEALAALAGRHLEHLGELVEAWQGPGTGDPDLLDFDTHLTTRMRQLVDAMIATQAGRHRALGRSAQREATAGNFVLLGGVAASLLMIAGLFLMTSREVTRRRRAEQSLKAVNAALEEQVAERTAALSSEVEERRRIAETLAAVVDGATLAIIGFDLDGNVVLWNRAAERIFGYGAEEVLGHRVPAAQPDGQEEFERIFDRTVAGKHVMNVAVRHRRKDGRLVDLMLSGVPLRDAADRHRSVVFMIEDVTERLQLEEQLRHAQRMEAVGQLTGGLAHDFNNLLGVIIGNLDLLRDEIESDPDGAELTDAALNAAMRGADLVRRLLAFSRRQRLDMRVVDLNELLPGIVTMLRRTLGAQITIDAVPAGDLWRVLTDPSQIEDAIVNLAINARDAMPNGGSLTIETANVYLDEHYAAQHAEVTSGEYVMLAVGDNGLGMPPEVVQRVFEPFFTTKDTGKGSGLGLSQVYGFVKQSGGHIKIYSEVGHGTVVKIYLPRGREESSADHAVAGGAAGMPLGNETILVVEDDAEVRRVVSRQLGELGYTVMSAPDAPAALAMLEEGAAADLLFTDIVMPGGMTGYDLARAVHERWPGLKVLLTSGYTEGAVRKGSSKANLLSKPYRKHDLARKVRAVIDGIE